MFVSIRINSNSVVATLLSKQYKLSAIGTMVLALIFICVAGYMWYRDELIREIMMPAFLGFLLLLVSTLLFYKSSETKEIGQSTGDKEFFDLLQYERFIIHPEVHGLKQLIIYNEAGNMVGKFVPGQSWLKYLEPLLGLMPFKHYIYSRNGLILTLNIKGIFKQKISVMDDDEHTIGIIHYNILRNGFKFNVEVEIDDRKYVSQSEALIGDVTIEDLIKITSFNVPVELTERYKHFSPRLYIIDNDLETIEGKVGLATLALYGAVVGNK